MKCVPMKPDVLAPHTKNVPAKSQNTGRREAMRSAANARTTGFTATVSGGVHSGGAP